MKTDDWKGIELGAYIPPDSVVPATEQFAFLNGHNRIKAKKLRGVISFGMLIPAPAGSKLGDDVAEQMNIIHYEPPLQLSTGGEVCKPPPGFVGSKYDVDSLRRYHHLFVDGEPVQITEKIHGANSRFTYREGVMYCGSRTEWKKEDEKNLWWKVLRATPTLEEFCKANPGLTVYGESFGQVQTLRYGINGVAFAAFDLAEQNGTFFDAQISRALLENSSVPCVPLIRTGYYYDFAKVCEFAEGESLVPGANHIREGCVVKPLKERYDEHIGRVILKVVGAGYLEKS